MDAIEITIDLALDFSLCSRNRNSGFYRTKFVIYFIHLFDFFSLFFARLLWIYYKLYQCTTVHSYLRFFEMVFGSHINRGEIFFWDSFSDELCSVDVSNWLDLLDDRVHEWLCEHWLIELVMSELSVTNQVNHNIFLE